MDNEIKLLNKQHLFIKGSEKVNYFTDKEASIKFKENFLLIKGEDLSLEKMDLLNKLIEVKGLINELKFVKRMNFKGKLKKLIK